MKPTPERSAAGDSLQELAQPFELAAVGRAHPALQGPPEGGVEVAVVEEVVGDLPSTPSASSSNPAWLPSQRLYR